MKKKKTSTKRAKARRPSARRPLAPRRHVIIEPNDPDFEDVTMESLARGETGIAIAGITLPRDDED